MLSVCFMLEFLKVKVGITRSKVIMYIRAVAFLAQVGPQGPTSRLSTSSLKLWNAIKTRVPFHTFLGPVEVRDPAIPFGQGPYGFTFIVLFDGPSYYLGPCIG